MLLTLVTIAVGLAAISTQSFWMDEGGTVFRAMMPTLKEWWRMILHLKGSEIQMASYMLYAPLCSTSFRPCHPEPRLIIGSR